MGSVVFPRRKTTDPIVFPFLTDESFLAEVLTKKFVDHLSLYRQSEIFLRDGIQISRQILSQWILRFQEQKNENNIQKDRGIL